ncbi:MAG: dephospho-CoA kinase [Lachnospiraceae bacterium]|nr:dephospho-CoA kinase [Lachnospiraceae bacterium]
MKFIGITGGVGAGKSFILNYLEEKYGARVLLTDEIAHALMEPGTECYEKLLDIFIEDDVFLDDDSFDKKALAKVIFEDEEKREALNSIVHPAVKEEVKRIYEEEKEKNDVEVLIVEAALLIEEHYDEICDELWYVYTNEEKRRKRLSETRGYSDEKIDDIMASQLSEDEFRANCKREIDNNADKESVMREVDELMETIGLGLDDFEYDSDEDGEPDVNNTQEESALKDSAESYSTENDSTGDRKMDGLLKEGEYVFGLDIGTRNVVGTVGFMEDEQFRVIAQYSTEHTTRSMIDGQIHDIGKVAKTIRLVKDKLEEQLGQPLNNVCIAAAGRVLETVTTKIEYTFEEETIVTDEDIHTLDLLGIDKAQELLREQNDTKYKFYCVGYSVVRYYLNDEIFGNLEGHKAETISEDIIVTFLPEDVVDGLYSACNQAGLSVANMTLEPIAAIDVAIPENYRMLNIALVDVGAGTSDISVTRDGSIIAYGMIPLAGDEITEVIVQQYLVDFNTAERIKLASTTQDTVEYEDIMGIKHEIPSQEIYDLTAPLVDKITGLVAEKIKELNGDNTVSATFVVGGGGKIHGFTETLAKKLDIPDMRVALRGEEVLKDIKFDDPTIQGDPLLVTPIGICLNYFEQKNSFIMVRFNDEKIKLYDNGRLTIVDAAMAAGFPNDRLFPRRGKEIHFTVNGSPRIARGEAGESAVVMMNDQVVNINTPLIPNSVITIEGSTEGDAARCTIDDLSEYTKQTVNFIVNGKTIICPKFVEVNGSLEMPGYEVKEGDVIETRSFYTVQQIAEFMDVEINLDYSILVNNRPANENSLVYENFSVDFNADVMLHEDEIAEENLKDTVSEETPEEISEEASGGNSKETAENTVSKDAEGDAEKSSEEADESGNPEEVAKEHKKPVIEEPEGLMRILVNHEPVFLTGKDEYVFVDIFEVVDFDLSASRGRALVTNINGEKAQYTQVLKENDEIDLYWEERQ